MRQLYAYDANESTPVDDWLKTGWARDSQTFVDSLFCITCSLENNPFSVLHCVIKVTLHFTLRYRVQPFPHIWGLLAGLVSKKKKEQFTY